VEAKNYEERNEEIEKNPMSSALDKVSQEFGYVD
jgi:hypothetical protein